MKYFLEPTKILEKDLDMVDENGQPVYVIKGNLGDLLKLGINMGNADFDITDENGQLVYAVKGHLGNLLGLRSKICSADGETELVTIKQRFLQSVFYISQNKHIVATVKIKRKWFSAKVKYIIEGLDWEMSITSLVKDEYLIVNRNGEAIANLYRQELPSSDKFTADMDDSKKNLERAIENIFTMNNKFVIDIVDLTEEPVLILAVILISGVIIDVSSQSLD